MQDKHIDLDEVTLLRDSTIFSLSLLPARSYEHDLDVQMSISIEMNRDLMTLSRTGYTPLDVLSDIGGMQSMIMSMMALFVGIWNHSHFDNFMA